MGALTGTYLKLHHICKQMLFCGLETLTSFFFFSSCMPESSIFALSGYSQKFVYQFIKNQSVLSCICA